MKKYAVFAAVVAMASQIVTPAFAAGASPFGDTTIYGQQRVASAAAMAYLRLPMNATKGDPIQPRAGIVVTAPQAYEAGEVVSRLEAPGIIDFGFTGHNFTAPWTATINVNGNLAWAEDPKSLPKNTHNMFESGTSWIVVGLLTVGVAGGVYALSKRK